jgi:hypothetical protein
MSRDEHLWLARHHGSREPSDSIVGPNNGRICENITRRWRLGRNARRHHQREMLNLRLEQMSSCAANAPLCCGPSSRQTEKRPGAIITDDDALVAVEEADAAREIVGSAAAVRCRDGPPYLGDILRFNANGVNTGRGSSPEAFMPLAEEIGVMVPSGEWAIREACATAAQWPRPTAARP